MALMFCSGCGIQFVSDATFFCTQCGSPIKASPAVPVQATKAATASVAGVRIVINAATPHTQVTASPEMRGTYGLPIPAMIIGIIFALGVFDDSKRRCCLLYRRTHSRHC